MKTNKFLMGALFCAFVAGLTGCNGNDPEQNGSNGTNGGGQTENPGGVTIDKSNGVLPGLFTVHESGKQIQFSMGNLQYTQSTQTWSFAKNQYDMIGTDNVTGGSVSHDAIYGDEKRGTALADKIDLFGWSGSTGAAKWGISISEDYNDYSGDFKDWGQNAISNGGNKANQWRTLTNEEWNYLITDRANASSLQGVASVNGVNGLILLPDGWKQPNGVSFKSGFSSDYSVQAYADYQAFTLDQWSKLESAGAVFLPASGDRYGTDVNDVGSRGDYWSPTPSVEVSAWILYFLSGEASMGGSDRLYGLAVRLVQDAK